MTESAPEGTAAAFWRRDDGTLIGHDDATGEALAIGRDGARASWREGGDFVQVGEYRLPAELHGVIPGVDGPDVVVDLAVVDGRPLCRRLTVESGGDGREVRSPDLRVAVDDLVAALYGMAAQHVVVFGNGKVIKVETVGAALVRFIPDRTARRTVESARRRLTDDLLRSVAEVYRDNLSDAPLQAVALRFNVRARQASNYVKAAETAGFLPTTTRGKRRGA